MALIRHENGDLEFTGINNVRDPIGTKGFTIKTPVDSIIPKNNNTSTVGRFPNKSLEQVGEESIAHVHSLVQALKDEAKNNPNFNN